jgi:hypothetical protein
VSQNEQAEKMLEEFTAKKNDKLDSINKLYGDLATVKTENIVVESKTRQSKSFLVVLVLLLLTTIGFLFY